PEWRKSAKSTIWTRVSSGSRALRPSHPQLSAPEEPAQLLRGPALQVLLRVVALALQFVDLGRERVLELVGSLRFQQLPRGARPVDLPARRGERAGDAH